MVLQISASYSKIYFTIARFCTNLARETHLSGGRGWNQIRCADWERHMDLSFDYFWMQITQNPLLFLAVLLTLGVILVNGWTDAPNAIATCVVTRCIPVRAAILMAAVCNFLGVFLMSMLNATVA